eukprot:scaffold12731_cov100-Isochrysis_galbana.AAC.3
MNTRSGQRHRAQAQKEALRGCGAWMQCTHVIRVKSRRARAARKRFLVLNLSRSTTWTVALDPLMVARTGGLPARLHCLYELPGPAAAWVCAE